VIDSDRTMHDLLLFDQAFPYDALFKFTRTRGDLHVSVVAAGIALFFLVFFWTQTGWDKRNLPDNILSYTAHQFGVIELDGRVTIVFRTVLQIKTPVTIWLYDQLPTALRSFMLTYF